MRKTVVAHLQKQTDALAFYYPSHEPRKGDPHYRLFNQMRRKLIAAGARCWICGTSKNLEIHHNEIEYAAATGVDLAKFEHLFPGAHVKTEEDLLNWCESPSNAKVLCALHHRGPFNGVHHVPLPNWLLQRLWKKGLPAPVEDGRK